MLRFLQYWWLNANWYILRDYSCVGVSSDSLSVQVMDCARARPWKYDKKRRKLEQGGKCLTVGAANNIYVAQMLPCQEGNPMQEWVFSRFSYQGIRYQLLGDENATAKE